MEKRVLRLEDQVAVVTGGSRGIGRAICIALAHEGARVVVNYYQHQDQAQEVLESVLTLGSKGIIVKADVSQAIEVEKMVQEAVQTFGRIDILVNNAGFCPFKRFLDLTEETWDRVIDVNLKGYFLVGQAVARLMVEQGIRGKIINISSASAYVSGLEWAGYASSKGGINQLTKTMAVSLGPHGIRCNALVPGNIISDINAGYPGLEAILNKAARLTPLRRIGTPEDVAKATVFLASDEASYISGATLEVDGGLLADARLASEQLGIYEPQPESNRVEPPP